MYTVGMCAGIAKRVHWNPHKLWLQQSHMRTHTQQGGQIPFTLWFTLLSFCAMWNRLQQQVSLQVTDTCSFFFLLCSGLSFPFFSLSAFVYFLWPVSYLLLFHVHEVANKQSGNIKYREHLESPFLLLRSQNSKDTHIHGIIHTHADKKDCMDGCVQILYTEVQRRMCTIHTAAHA